MSRTSRTTRTPIGVDVGRRYVKAAQLSRTRTGWRLEAAASLPRGESDRIDRPAVRQLREVMSRQGFTGSGVVLAAPREDLMTTVLELPPRSSGAPLDRIARTELAGIHKLRPGSFEMACWDLPAAARASRATQVMAAACPHAPAERLLDAFEQEGLDVKALDVAGCALARACGPFMPGEAAIAALLDLGWQAAQLVLLHQGVVVYQRTLERTGIRSLSEALAGRLALDVETIEPLLGEVGAGPGAGELEDEPFEELRGAVADHLGSIAREVQASFSYAVRLYPDALVERLLLVGGGASIPGVSARFGSALGVEVLAPGAGDLADCAESVVARCGSTALTMAIGLAEFVDE